MLTTQTLATPVGPMQAVFSPQGLCMLEFAHSKLCAPQLAAVVSSLVYEARGDRRNPARMPDRATENASGELRRIWRAVSLIF